MQDKKVNIIIDNITTQLGHSQCPLVVTNINNSLFRLTNMTTLLKHLQFHMVETDSTTSLFTVYRYHSSTGTFTVPPGGDGFYYFSVYLLAHGAESAIFNVELNGELLCTNYSDLTESPSSDEQSTSCSGITYAAEGKLRD